MIKKLKHSDITPLIANHIAFQRYAGRLQLNSLGSPGISALLSETKGHSRTAGAAALVCLTSESAHNSGRVLRQQC
jgi:hypothetical protein